MIRTSEIFLILTSLFFLFITVVLHETLPASASLPFPKPPGSGPCGKICDNCHHPDSPSCPSSHSCDTNDCHDMEGLKEEPEKGWCARYTEPMNRDNCARCHSRSQQLKDAILKGRLPVTPEDTSFKAEPCPERISQPGLSLCGTKPCHS